MKMLTTNDDNYSWIKCDKS